MAVTPTFNDSKSSESVSMELGAQTFGHARGRGLASQGTGIPTRSHAPPGEKKALMILEKRKRSRTHDLSTGRPIHILLTLQVAVYNSQPCRAHRPC